MIAMLVDINIVMSFFKKLYFFYLEFIERYRKRKCNLIVLILICFSSSSFAQDSHFSQLNTTPLFLNPASAGALGQDYRASVHYKNQWNAVSNAYKTMGVSVDGKILKKGRDKKNSLGIGLTVFSDKAGITNYSNLQINGLVAYQLQITRVQQISFGLSIGAIQRSINITNLKWDAQFDGNIYDSSRETGENSSFQKTISLDAGAGALWKLQPKSSPFKLEVGVAIAHIAKPKSSFYNKSFYTPIKYVIQVNSQIKVGSLPLVISPQVLYSLQIPYQETVLGSQFKYIIGQDSRDGFLNTYSLTSSAIGIGCYYRLKDALIFVLSYDYKKTMSFNIGYDINVSSLKSASNKRGGMEISFIFKGFYRTTGLSNIPVD